MLTFQRGAGARSSRRHRPPGATMATRAAALLLALLLGLGHHGVGAQGPGRDLSCDAPLGIDETMLFLQGFRYIGDGAYPLSYYYQSTNCHGCDLIPLVTLAHANATACAKVSTKWPTRLRAAWTAEDKGQQPKPIALLARSVERTVQLAEKAFITIEVVGNVDPQAPEVYTLVVDQAGGYPTYRPILYSIWAGLGLLVLTWLLQQLLKDDAGHFVQLLQYFPRPPTVVAEPRSQTTRPRARVRREHDASLSSDDAAGAHRPATGGGAGAGLRRRRQRLPQAGADATGKGKDAAVARSSGVSGTERETAAAPTVASTPAAVAAAQAVPAAAAAGAGGGELDEEELLYREFEEQQRQCHQHQGEQQPAGTEVAAGPGHQDPPSEQQPQEPPEDTRPSMAKVAAMEEGRVRTRDAATTMEGGNRRSKRTPPAVAAHGRDEEQSTTTTTAVATLPPLPRNKALDVLRGLSVLAMVFVNYGGGGYALFEHSAWDGLAFADVLFPTFVFVSGASAALSLRRLQQRLDALSTKAQQRRVWAVKRKALHKVLRRALVLFALGLFLNNGYEVSHWRVPGVLQYLAWCNLVVPALLILAARATEAPPQPQQPQPLPSGLLEGAKQAAWRFRRLLFPASRWEPRAALLLPILHLALAYLVAAPGCPRGYVGPGGTMVDGGRLAHCTGGAHGYLDRLLFSTPHLLQDPPCRGVYGTGAYDPEGILGSLNAAFLFYLGVLAGRVLLLMPGSSSNSGPARARSKEVPWRLLAWVVLACPLALLAGILGGGGIVPVNKSLWSLSFVLANAALGLALLATAHLLCDVSRAWPSGRPFSYVGRNALAIYIGHILLQDYFPFSFEVPAALADTHGGALLEDAVGTLAWLLIAWGLDWRRTYIKV